MLRLSWNPGVRILKLEQLLFELLPGRPVPRTQSADFDVFVSQVNVNKVLKESMSLIV